MINYKFLASLDFSQFQLYQLNYKSKNFQIDAVYATTILIFIPKALSLNCGKYSCDFTPKVE